MIFKKKVTKEMSILQVTVDMPVARDIMIRNGIKFTGENFNALDSIEKVLKGNGLDDKEIDDVVNEINNHKEEFKMILTKNAALKLEEILQQKEMSAVKLRFYSDGAATHIYDMDFANNKNEEEIETSSLGLKFFVEKKSAPFLRGTTIDYDATEDSFVFNNPNIKR